MISILHLPIFLTTAVALVSSSVFKAPERNFELLILHNNDMHARFEQTSQLSGACSIADREAGKCYGGFPRVAHVVKEARKAAASGEGPPVLYLNAGDTYTGTAWFTIYKWKVAAEFLNALQPDAVSFGNNEFEEGSAEISPFLKNIETTVLATNVILNTPEKAKLQKSVIFEVDGVKVAIVSYLSPAISQFDNLGALEYIDEVLALTDEVKKLKEQKVPIIIALGHANKDKLLEIATEVDGLDLIINGHENRYYWNGTTINDQELEIKTQTTISKKAGKRVPIVQSYAYNQGLGKINIKFNGEGEIFNYEIEQITLDFSVPEDLSALQIIKKYNKDIVSKGQEVIGETAVIIDGNTCKLEECNIGNLITDSMVYHHAVRFQGDHWTDAPIAIIHSQPITSSIAPANRPAAITRAQLLSAIQSEGNVVSIKMNGTILKQVLEHSVSDYRLSNPSGRFLQYSGIRVTYDFAENPRLVKAVVRCQACNIPQFYPIDDDKEYTILMPLLLANGGQGYSMLVGLPRQILAYDEARCSTDYIAQRSPVYPEVAGRITLLNRNAAPNSGNTLCSTYLFTFIILCYSLIKV